MVVLTHSFGTQWTQVSKPLRTEVAEFKCPRCWQMHLFGSEGLSKGKIIANLDLSSLHSWRYCCFLFWIRQLTCSFLNLDHCVYLFFKMISFTEHGTGKLSSPSPLSSLYPPKCIWFSLRRKYYRKIFNLSVGGNCEPLNMGVGFCVLSLTAFSWRKFLKRHVSDKSNLKSEVILQKHCVGIIESERRAFLKTSIQKRLWHLIKHFFVCVGLNFFTYIFTLWMQESLQSRSWLCV